MPVKSTMEDFLDFIMEAMDISEEEFVQAFPEPFLLVEFEGIQRVGDLERPKSYGKRGFADTITGIPIGLERIRDDKICRLKKSEEGSPDAPVLLGRAPDNDIILDYPRVSKRHASIEASGSGAWQITDAGSTNGTQVNQKPLEKGSTVALLNGDRIDLGGDFFATFYTPAGLFTYINQLAEEMEGQGGPHA